MYIHYAQVHYLNFIYFILVRWKWREEANCSFVGILSWWFCSGIRFFITAYYYWECVFKTLWREGGGGTTCVSTVQDSYNRITPPSRPYNMQLVFNIPTALRVERVRVPSAYFLSPTPETHSRHSIRSYHSSARVSPISWLPVLLSKSVCSGFVT